jgi:PAS domain S-box-containing protein
MLHALGERNKELRLLYDVTSIVRVVATLPELFAEIANTVPPAWQYPEITSARISFDEKSYASPDFREGAWRLSSDIVTHGRRRGRVDVFYHEDLPQEAEGPFLREERQLIDWLTQYIGKAVELREAEQELRLHRERLEELVESRTRALELARYALDHAGEAAFWIDRDGSFFDVNEQACRLLEYTREELLNLKVADLVQGFGVGETEQRFGEIVAVGGSRTSERVAIAKGGRTLPVETTTVSRFNDRTFALALVRDTTERNRTAVELAEAKAAAEAANRAKSAFLAHMSHEIRTPMNAVLGFAQLLQRDATLAGKQREHVDTILRSGEHLLDIINDVIEMSKIEAGHVSIELETFDVRVLLSDLERMFRERAQAKALRFEVEAVASVPPYVRGDQGKIRQIIVNLLGNAIKFTKHGRVDLRLGFAPRAAGRFELRFEIEDTGPGIAARDLPLLFREFQQTAAGRGATGSGLGLAISRRYARLMGGDVTVMSTLGKGSTFTASVEVEPATAEHSRSSIAARRIRGLAPGTRPINVVVVDDHADSRAFLRNLFAEIGFDVVEARSGAEALSLVERRAPDLLLLDINMPEMSGVELLKRLRERADGRDITVVAVSASVLDDSDKAAVTVRADGFVRKPVDASEILELVGSKLGVRYLTEGEDPSSQEVQSQRSLLSARVLAAVARDTRVELRRAAERADAGRLRRLLAELETESPALANELRRLVDAYDYDTILGLSTDSES